MIVKEEFLSQIRRYFALNLYEVKIWSALLSRGVATAGELSDIANVPRSRSYDVLESLERKGFVIMKLGKPIKYIAVPPTEVLERVGWFDIRFFMYCEDVDLCRRINDAGWKLYYLSDAEVIHLAGGASKKRSNQFSTLLTCESIAKLMKKYYGSLQ